MGELENEKKKSPLQKLHTHSIFPTIMPLPTRKVGDVDVTGMLLLPILRRQYSSPQL